MNMSTFDFRHCQENPESKRGCGYSKQRKGKTIKIVSNDFHGMIAGNSQKYPVSRRELYLVNQQRQAQGLVFCP